MADSEETNLGDYPLTDIPHPHPHDVLCGRGGGSNNWIGNSHWRMLVAANKQLYVTLPKRQKMLLSRSIVHAVRSQDPPGRFLQKDSKSDRWYDIGDQRAQEKTSQALREGAPELRTKLKDDKPRSKSSGSSKSCSGPAPESRSDEGARSPPPPSDSSVSGSVHAPSNPPSRATSGSVAAAPQLSQQTSTASIGQVLPPAAVANISNAQPMAPSSMPPPAMRPSGITDSSINQQQQQQQQQQPQRQHQRQNQQPQQQQQQQQLNFQQQQQQQQTPIVMMHPQMQNVMPQMMQGQHPQQMMNGAMFFPGPNMAPMQMYPAMMYNQQGMLVPVMSMIPPNMQAQMGGGPSNMQQQQQGNNNANNNNNSSQQQQHQQKMHSNKLVNGVNDSSSRQHQQQKEPNQNQHGNFNQQRHGNVSHFDQKLEGLALPPDGLEAGGFSFGSIGSIMMTENEMKRLETAGNSFGPSISYGTNVQGSNNNGVSHAQQQQQRQQQQQFLQQQYLQQQQHFMEQYHHQQQQLAMQQHHHNQGQLVPTNFLGKLNDDHLKAVPPPDGGLEPQGLSFGSVSMMSIGDAKLEATGISFGSAMSFRMTPDMVEGGLDNIGMSFGSMTLATNNEETFDPQQNPHSIVPPPPSGPNAAKSTDTMPTLFHQNRSAVNLLDCSDTDSDDEEQSAQRSQHKSLEWEKMKSLVNAGNGANNGAEPLPLPPTQSFPSSFAMPATTTFQRDFSQMSQLSVGDGDHNDSNLSSLQLMAAAVMPPPPPKKQGEDGGWQNAELLLLKSQQSGSNSYASGRR